MRTITELILELSNVSKYYDKKKVLDNISLNIKKGSVNVILGPSGCGKSTLLKHLIGLQQPIAGCVELLGAELWKLSEEERTVLTQRIGVLYQAGALWSSMTLAENIALPLKEHTSLSRREIAEVVDWKLSLVGLGGFGKHYPSEISGGMRKRAGLARAMALDPEILFFDEPSAGLDPVSSRRLDELIVEIAESLNSAVVVVTHELESILKIGTNSIFLDADLKTIRARGCPRELLKLSSDPVIQQFLGRNDLGERHP